MSSLSSIGSTSALLSGAGAAAAAGTPSSTGTLSVGGLITGLNTSQLIQGLLAVQQSQIDALKARQTAITRKETAYKALEAQLLGFQASVSALSQATNGPFDGRSATTSDNTLVTAAASSSAAPGTYTLTVNAVAQANQVATQGYASPTANVTHGTLKVGSGGNTTTLTVDGSNDTLQGLAAAINGANVGVSATVINDGSSSPYRLLLTSNKTGTANAVTFDPGGLAADNGGAIKPAINKTLQAAADASVSLGSGPGALTVTNSGNTIDSLISGVTLSLVAANAGKPVTVTVASNTDQAKTAVEGFVTAYNSVQSTVATDVAYDPQTKSAGPLLGDPSILGIQDQLQNLVINSVGGANPKLNNLGALGITLDAGGQLQVNDGALTNVLSGGVSGVTLADVRNLFALSGQSTNPGVTFLTGTGATKPSGATPYGVDVSRAATSAAVTAGAAPPSLTVGPGDNTFKITVDGVTSGTVTLPASTYASAAALAQTLQAQINADGSLAGRQVTAGVDGSGRLTLTSNSYGHSSAVALGPVDFLGFTAAASAAGQDVAGSFLVNGVAEAAAGNGQLLTGNAGNAHTDGLAVRVTLSAAQVNPAPNTPEASLTVSGGLAAQLGSALNGLLDPVSGRLQGIDQNFQDQISSLQSTIDQQNKAYTDQQNALQQKFAALETTVNQLKTAGGYLSTLLASTQSLAYSGVAATPTTH